jgi:hypothetical protein
MVRCGLDELFRLGLNKTSKCLPRGRPRTGQNLSCYAVIAEEYLWFRIDRAKLMRYLMSPSSSNSLRSFPVSIGFIK